VTSDQNLKTKKEFSKKKEACGCPLIDMKFYVLYDDIASKHT